MKENTRVAVFPCVYHEVDGVAKTGREFEAFASRHEIPFFTVHAGRRDLVTTAGPVTRVQLPRSPLKFPLDRAHDYDLLFGRRTSAAVWFLPKALAGKNGRPRGTLEFSRCSAIL